MAREVAKNAAGGSVAFKASLPNCAAAVRLALPATRAELADLDRSLWDSVAVADRIPATETQSVAFRQARAQALSVALMSNPILSRILLSLRTGEKLNLYLHMASSSLDIGCQTSMCIG